MVGLQPRSRRLVQCQLWSLLQCWLRWLVEVLLRIERAALGALHSMVELGALLPPLRGVPVLLLLLLLLLLLWRRARPGVVVVSCAVERSRLFMWCMSLLLVRVTRVTGLIVMCR